MVVGSIYIDGSCEDLSHCVSPNKLLETNNPKNLLKYAENLQMTSLFHLSRLAPFFEDLSKRFSFKT